MNDEGYTLMDKNGATGFEQAKGGFTSSKDIDSQVCKRERYTADTKAFDSKGWLPQSYPYATDLKVFHA